MKYYHEVLADNLILEKLGASDVFFVVGNYLHGLYQSWVAGFLAWLSLARYA